MVMTAISIMVYKAANREDFDDFLFVHVVKFITVVSKWFHSFSSSGDSKIISSHFITTV
ncbi:hypothetical protein [Bacillus alveayuensis]|uniref:hypothetical protein n=1 Tax=Aeribacillus alveayuensis TaxID=279215 RepID=UPI000A5D2198|nr:hypothetical protein [Bacillus alveayuensis]